MDTERVPSQALGVLETGREEGGVCLAQLSSLVQHLVQLLKRQRAAMARRDTRALSLLLTEEEEVARKLKELAQSTEGAQVLAASRAAGSSAGNPALAGLYRQLLAGLVELIAVNRANQEFLVAAQQAIRGALYWHPDPEGHERLVCYTRRGRIAV